MIEKNKFRDIDHLAILLESDIRNRQLYMLNTANSGLLELFWKVGELLDQNINSLNQGLLERLAAILQVKYGAYFSVFALNQMQRFGSAVKADLLRDVSMGAGWKHIPILNSLTGSKDWLYYADLVYLKQLSPLELEKKLKQAETIPIETVQASFPSIFDKALIERFMENVGYDQFFRVGKDGDFKKLFELKSSEKTITNIKKLYPLVEEIDQKVIYFRKCYNTVIYNIANGSFRYVCSQIGSAYRALAQKNDMETLLGKVSDRFNGAISIQWLDHLLKTYNSDNQDKTIGAVQNVGKEEYQKGNLNVEVTTLEIAEDFETGIDIYKDPDIMYFLENA